MCLSLISVTIINIITITTVLLLVDYYYPPPFPSPTPPGFARTLFCGGVAGVVLWTAIFPADVAKSRIQVAGSTESMTSVLMGIVRTEGEDWWGDGGG